jgi:hypothetical protein
MLNFRKMPCENTSGRTGGRTNFVFPATIMQAFSVLYNRGMFFHAGQLEAGGGSKEAIDWCLSAFSKANGVVANFSREASEAKEESIWPIGTYGSVNMPTIEQPALEI